MLIVYIECSLIMRGQFDCVFSFVEVRAAKNVAGSSCGGRYFRKAPHVDADIFLNGLRKIHFQNYPDTCGRGLRQKNCLHEQLHS